jgi:hypothetical protein
VRFISISLYVPHMMAVREPNGLRVPSDVASIYEPHMMALRTPQSSRSDFIAISSRRLWRLVLAAPDCAVPDAGKLVRVLHFDLPMRPT